jgi:UDP-glucose 4-epimerase
LKADSFMEKEVTSLVTGGAGFIGSHLVDALLEKGHRVLIVDNLTTGKKENINPKAQFFNLDIRHFDKLKSVFKNVNFVFHLAAIPRIPLSVQNPRETNEVNITGTLNVLLSSKENNAKKLVFSSSSSVYGEPEDLPAKESIPCVPLSPYALQKYVGELYCQIFSQLYELPTVVLRYSSVYGPRQPTEGSYKPVISVFLEQKKTGKPLTVTGDGTQSRDLTHVSDVVRANILSLESEQVGRGEVINIAGGREYSINEIAKIIGGEITHIPSRSGEVKRNSLDINLAQKLLGWEPRVKLEQGIKELLLKI